MSKKDYELIASVIEALSTVTSKRDVALMFSQALARPGFDTAKFLQACGVLES